MRVHLAEAEKSVFVRDNLPPTASVMVRLARGRQLGEGQVSAIVNLVAASVPGLSPDAVRVVDQHGRLLSEPGMRGQAEADRLDLQARMEEKLRGQLRQLLTPMLGEGNFSSEIQVELDMDEVTSARESYDKDGVRAHREQRSSRRRRRRRRRRACPACLSNTPPPAAPAAQPGAAAGHTPAPLRRRRAATNGESSATAHLRTGPRGRGRQRDARQAQAPVGRGRDQRRRAQGRKPAEIAADQAAGQRGGRRRYAARRPGRRWWSAASSRSSTKPSPFYEAPWFATLVRNGVALIAVLLVLLLACAR